MDVHARATGGNLRQAALPMNPKIGDYKEALTAREDSI